MAFHGIPTLSLVAQFDDLCRSTEILTTGCEEEFKTFVENQLIYCRSLNESESEIRKLNERIADLQSERVRMETRMKHLMDRCEVERAKRLQVEKEKSSMARILAVIRDMLLEDNNNNLDNETKEKLAFLSNSSKLYPLQQLDVIEESMGSLFSLSDVDHTEEDLENKGHHSRRRRTRGKRSGSGKKASPKKKKSGDTGVKLFDNDLPESGNVENNGELASHYPLTPIVANRFSTDSDQFITHDVRRRKKTQSGRLSSTPVDGRNSAGKMSQSHRFVPKMVIRKDKCCACGQKMSYFSKQAVKCEDCKIVCHLDCQQYCAMQCNPKVDTPNRGSTGTDTDCDSEAIYAAVIKSPESIPAPKGTRLGPVYKQKHHTSRHSRKSSSKSSEMQFSSPLLK